MSNQLVGVSELAEALGVDRSTVHRRIARGEVIAYTVVGNRPLFRPEDVEQMAGKPQLPAVGSLWRFKSSPTPYRVTEVTEWGVSLESTETRAHTTVRRDDVERRLLPIEGVLA